MFLDNPNFNDESSDVLYHFGLTTGTHDFVQLFGDVKFVCCGGSAKRMEKFANTLLKELDISSLPAQNICHTDRYVIFKAGPVLCVNHGMGMPSLSIMLHELFKLLHHAQCSDVFLFRMGTSGGIGVQPGTVVVTEHAYSALLERSFSTECIGKSVSWPTSLNQQLCAELCQLGSSVDFPVVKGNTMGTNDFYEGQGRLDGAVCCYSKSDKMAFLEKANSLGIKNIEMESPAFAALTNRAGVKAAVVCVTLLDRMKEDQISEATPVLKGYDDRPAQLLISFIKKRLYQQSNGSCINGGC